MIKPKLASRHRRYALTMVLLALFFVVQSLLHRYDRNFILKEFRYTLGNYGIPDYRTHSSVLHGSSYEYSLSFPMSVKSIHINIGPNTSPLLPPSHDQSTAVLAIEANVGISNLLRETKQKLYRNRFFIMNTAVGGHPLSGSVGKFNYYNKEGRSSSLSAASKSVKWANPVNNNVSDKYGPGSNGFDFVPVLSLDAILSAIPSNISIPYLLIDTQGHDLNVIKSSSGFQLKRIKKVVSEVYIAVPKDRKYVGVNNDLHTDWMPYMSGLGFKLDNPPPAGRLGEYDAVWIQDDRKL